MENSLENKAKFFAQYWYQKLWKINDVRMLTDGWIEEKSMIEKSWLEVKSLLEITDAELLEAITILDYKNEFTNLGSIQIGREIIVLVNNINSEIARNDIHPHYIFHFADYLRSKGYAIPWMGLSVETLIEYGWIKFKN